MKTLWLSFAAIGLLMLSQTVHADIQDVPLPDGFEVRMEMSDDYPMIVSGFVKQDLESVMAFYRETLGEPNDITGDIGRYTYFYSLSGKQVRIGFYQQEQWCELSIMMTK